MDYSNVFVMNNMTGYLADTIIPIAGLVGATTLDVYEAGAGYKDINLSYVDGNGIDYGEQLRTLMSGSRIMITGTLSDGSAIPYNNLYVINVHQAQRSADLYIECDAGFVLPDLAGGSYTITVTREVASRTQSLKMLLRNSLAGSGVGMYIEGGWKSTVGQQQLFMPFVSNFTNTFLKLFIQGPSQLNALLPLYTLSTALISANVPLYVCNVWTIQSIPLYCQVQCNGINAMLPLFIKSGLTQTLNLMIPFVDFPWSNINAILPMFLEVGKLTQILPMYISSANPLNIFIPLYIYNSPLNANMSLFIKNNQLYYTGFKWNSLPILIPNVSKFNHKSVNLCIRGY